MLLRKYFLLHFLLITTPKSELQSLEEDGEEDLDDVLGPADGEIAVVNILENSENSSQAVDRSDEEWVKDAVLDVAYYLRAHKFNDFDRRYFKEASSEESYQYRHFPNPPLRYLHWEVSKYCEKEFYDCLAYLQDTVLKAGLIRAQDTNVVMNQRHWEFPRNAKSIDKLDQECVRLKTADWRDADPFKGPLERFQWRVSASYFMCFYSMQELSPLVMFGERCDNFASCLVDKTPFNGDPRGDDSFPYQCALYSFCPDVCCPLKKINDVEQCLDTELNPCHWHKDRSKRVCSFSREMNRDLTSIALNQWNVSCQCEPGYEWMSEFGACVDVDECSQGTHNCTPPFETCINLKGEFACVCSWGYINHTGTCEHNHILSSAMAALHRHHHAAQQPPPRPFSFFSFLFHWPLGLFRHSRPEEPSTELPLLAENSGRPQVVLDPEEI